jgi:hypothetical protein
MRGDRLFGQLCSGSVSTRGHANEARSPSGAQDVLDGQQLGSMHDPIAKTAAWIKRMLEGRQNYFAVSRNHPGLWWLFNGCG